MTRPTPEDQVDGMITGDRAAQADPAAAQLATGPRPCGVATPIMGADLPPTSSPDEPGTQDRIDRLRARIAPLRHALLAHPIYSELGDIGGLRRFMEYHVHAVWDFMALLKALQRRVCCVDVPWTPPADPAACRLVNQIVLGEESDEDEAGLPASHFDLYRRAMLRCGADAGPIDRLVEDVRSGREARAAIEGAGLPGPVRRFLGRTFDVIESGDVCAIASAFTFGREGLLPDVFRRVVGELGGLPGSGLGGFRHYLDRHISVDGDDHGPKAERLVGRLCGGDPARWASAEAAAVGALEARLALWDGIAGRLGEARP